MNVEFSYQYRDAGNWKKYGRAVFTNPDDMPIDEAHARIVAACPHPFEDMNWFIPERVGLEPLREGWDIDLDGPWHEYVDECCATDDRPTDGRTLREFVMQFERYGMAGAAPRFQVNHRMVRADEMVRYEVEYRKDITGIDHPDAEFIAHASTDIPDLIAEVRRLRAIVGGAP